MSDFLTYVKQNTEMLAKALISFRYKMPPCFNQPDNRFSISSFMSHCLVAAARVHAGGYEPIRSEPSARYDLRYAEVSKVSLKSQTTALQTFLPSRQRLSSPPTIVLVNTQGAKDKTVQEVWDILFGDPVTAPDYLLAVSTGKIKPNDAEVRLRFAVMARDTMEDLVHRSHNLRGAVSPEDSDTLYGIPARDTPEDFIKISKDQIMLHAPNSEYDFCSKEYALSRRQIEENGDRANALYASCVRETYDKLLA